MGGLGYLRRSKLSNGNGCKWDVSRIYRYSDRFCHWLFPHILLWRDQTPETTGTIEDKRKEIVLTPIEGRVTPLDQAIDQAFAKE